MSKRIDYIIDDIKEQYLENDNNIKSLFKKKESSEKVWKIIKVGDFKETLKSKVIKANNDLAKIKNTHKTN